MGAFTTASANSSPERQEGKIRSLNKVIVICHLGQDPADPLHLACPSLKRPERTERVLVPNPKNWRRHPKAQSDALRGCSTRLATPTPYWSASCRTVAT